nr:MAG TPA: hypothetical protein [Caudoviricetes sp.]
MLVVSREKFTPYSSSTLLTLCDKINFDYKKNVIVIVVKLQGLFLQ